MTPNEINEAIAKSLGWADHLIKLDSGLIVNSGLVDLNGEWQQYAKDYYSDLNACAEFEASLTDYEYRNKYINNLQDRVLETLHPDSHDDLVLCEFTFATANAPQRCEAYLKTKGLWKE